MNDLLYAISRTEGATNLKELGAATGLDPRELAAALKDPVIRKRLEIDIRQGLKLGILRDSELFDKRQRLPGLRPIRIHIRGNQCRAILELKPLEDARGLQERWSRCLSAQQIRGRGGWLVAAALTALVLSIAVLAAVPPVDRDALTHHLAVPKMYLQHGGIYEIPHVPFSYYPMNLDLLYMIPLYFGNDIFPKYIHFGFALLTVGLIISFLYRRLPSPTGALLGGLLFLSLPVIVKLSITVYVDLGLIFFSTAALLQLLRWAEMGFRPKHLVLSGIFTGLCIGTKPNGMLSLFILVLAIPFMRRPEAGTQSPRRQEEQREHSRTSMALRPWVGQLPSLRLRFWSTHPG